MNDDSRSDDRSNSRVADILISLSVGVLAGVAGALLLAPESGRNTRRRLGEMAGGVADKQAYRQAREDLAS